MLNNLLRKTLLSALLPLLAAAAQAAPAAKEAAVKLPPASDFKAADMPYDAGAAALLTWNVLPGTPAAVVFQVSASTQEKGGWIKVAETAAEANRAGEMKLPFWAWKPAENGRALRVDLAATPFGAAEEQKVKFALRAVDGKQVYDLPESEAEVKGNWFNLARLNNFLLVLVIIVVFFWTVSHARRKGLFIRRIAGLDAIDEAIGRATEMGRPIYYSTGIGAMSSVPTIASTSILGEVARKVAQYDTQLKVPHFDPIVMTVAKEIVKQSYTEANRPDSYRDDINFFVSQDQFSFAAAVDGMIHREKPAACFFIGHFMAESLLLAEVGASTGAIQIAGTEQESQLPFFFTACDYTLIGEELYAAGAYLSKEPMLLSTLKVQDFGKAFVMGAVAVGSLLMLGGAWFKWDRLLTVITQIFKAY